MRGIFFGATPVVAEIVHKTINIKVIAIESQRFSKEIFNFSHYIGADLIFVDSIDEVLRAVRDVNIGISYGFGLKFSKQVIDSFSHGLINIHTGDLPNYRGRHPISWAMIKGEDKIGVTVHQVDEQFDSGYLIHKFYVDRFFYDDLHTIETKIETALAIEFPKAMKNLFNGDFSKIQEGAYLDRIDQVFATVDPRKMQSKQLFSLFRSQKIYSGVNILGQKKTECHIYNKAFDNHYIGYEIYECADQVLVAIK